MRDKIRRNLTAPIKTFFGYDELEELKLYRDNKEPFLYIDHAYFDRGYDKANFRVIFSSIHQNHVFDVPSDRRKKFKVRLKPWRQGEEIIFIPAPANPLWFHQQTNWNEEAIDKLVSITNRKIVIKADKKQPLLGTLNNCWALVTHSSVAGVEAVINGIPVVCDKSCPAHAVGVDLDNIEYPEIPDREQWLNTLTYSQFTLQEMQSGAAWSIIKEMHSL